MKSQRVRSASKEEALKETRRLAKEPMEVRKKVQESCSYFSLAPFFNAFTHSCFLFFEIRFERSFQRC